MITRKSCHPWIRHYRGFGSMAQAMGVSLGKANYCLKALMEKGLVKLENFRNNPDKRHYAYLLTAAGLEEKTRITMAFLRRKVAEYETLEKEIEQLRGELPKRSLRPEVSGEQVFGEDRAENR